MQHKMTVAFLVIFSTTLILLVLPADHAISQELQRVLVTNFPLSLPNIPSDAKARRSGSIWRE